MLNSNSIRDISQNCRILECLLSYWLFLITGNFNLTRIIIVHVLVRNIMTIIHEFFSDDVDNKLWICDTGKSSSKKTPTSTTSQLWVRLRSCHPKLASEAEERKKQDRKKRQSCSVKLGIDPKQSKLNLRVKKSVDPERKKRYDAAVTKFIVCDERPLELSVGAEFQKLCKKLTDSSYVPPRPTTTSRKVRGPVLSNTK